MYTYVNESIEDAQRRLVKEADDLKMSIGTIGDMSELCAPSNRYKENAKITPKSSKARNWGKYKADMMHNKAVAKCDRTNDRRQQRRSDRAERSAK